MSHHEKHVYVLSSLDVVRIRELLSMFSEAIDHIFDRTETTIYPDDEDVMADLDFHVKCDRCKFASQATEDAD